LRSRGEKLERTFAHCYETGAMRRLHLRGRDNVAKRVLIHAAAFNVALLMRVAYGLRKPRSLSARAAAAACARIWAFMRWLGTRWLKPRSVERAQRPRRLLDPRRLARMVA
jgi:transposase